MDIKLLSPSCWADYELIDSGAFEKLERFGRYVIARPEPQAIWNKSLPDVEWQQRADAYFKKDKKSEDRGEWICKPKMPQQWFVNYRYGEYSNAFGIDFFQARGDIPGAGGELEFYIRSGETNWFRGKSVEPVCLHRGSYSCGEECRCGCYPRGFGKAGCFLGQGKHGSIEIGWCSLDRG